jgi:hypothetical protein
MHCFSFRSCFSFSLSDLSEKVYVQLVGGVVSRVVVIIFLGAWLSSNDIKVLLFGIALAAFIVLFVLPSTTSIHSPSSCSLLFPCPPRRQSSLSSFLSSFAALALCFCHLSSFPFLNSCPLIYLSPICLHTAAYLKHTAFLFQMHCSVKNFSGCCVFPYFLQYLHVASTAFFLGLHNSSLDELLLHRLLLLLLLLLLFSFRFLSRWCLTVGIFSCELFDPL